MDDYLEMLNQESLGPQIPCASFAVDFLSRNSDQLKTFLLSWFPDPAYLIIVNEIPVPGRDTMMYTVKHGLSLVREDKMGVNAPMDHQRVISQLTVGLGKLFYYDKLTRLEPLPETMLDEGHTSPVPDLNQFLMV